MSKGNYSGSPKNFMGVSFGKFRQKTTDTGQKVDETTPGAVKRETQNGSATFAIEYDFISGVIENIFYKDGGEYDGKRMKNTFEVVIADGPDKDQISFKEDDRYWFAFMKKLPNIILDKPIKIIVYDFIGKDKKRVVGLQVEQDDNPNTIRKEKKDGSVVFQVLSYYDKKDGDKWTSLHGLPSGEGIDWKDEDDRKVHIINVKKFLNAEFNEKFANKFTGIEHPEVDSSEPPIDEGDGLPF